MSFLLLIRYLNIVVAILALGLNLDKMIRYQLWRVIDSDAVYRWMSLYGLLVAYILATSLAQVAGVPVGIWTLIWTPSLLWALISGLVGRGAGMNERPSKISK